MKNRTEAALDRNFGRSLGVLRTVPRLACLALLMAVGATTRAAEIGVVIADHPITDALPEAPHVEPHLAISPHEPQHLVAGVIVAGPKRAEKPWHCAALASWDGGRSWTRTDLTVIDRCIDPWAAVLADGTALLAMIEILRDGEGDQRLALRVARSPDGGRTWEAPVDLGRGWEHPFLLEGGGRVLLAGRRTVEREEGRRHEATILESTDGGRTFEPLAARTVSNLTNTVTGLLRSGGQLVLSILDEPRFADGPVDTLATRRSWALRSADGGRTWSAPLFVTDACGDDRSFPGWPALAGPIVTGGRTLLAHACVTPGLAGVAVSLSEDAGETWRAPVTLGNPRAETTDARTPMLATTPDGALAVAWYDRSLDPDRCSQEPLLAISTDGGATFSDPRPLSSTASCPRTPENGRVGESWAMGGDYGSLAVAPDGTLHALWADARDGRFRIHHSAIRIEGEQATDERHP